MRRSRLRHEILLALAGKAVALGLLYAAFFSPAHGTRLTPGAVSLHLLAPGDARTER